MEFERVVRVLEERECLRFRREVNRSEFERIVRERVGHSKKEKKRTTVDCGGGGSGDE